MYKFERNGTRTSWNRPSVRPQIICRIYGKLVINSSLVSLGIWRFLQISATHFKKYLNNVVDFLTNNDIKLLYQKSNVIMSIIDDNIAYRK